MQLEGEFAAEFELLGLSDCELRVFASASQLGSASAALLA